jgi:hypothetical protein
MKLNTKENADHSFYYALMNYHSSLEVETSEKKYEQGIISETKGNGVVFELNGYHLPPNKYLMKISLQLLFQSLELYLKECICKRFGEKELWINGNRTIGFVKSIDLYDTFAGIKLEKEILLDYREERNRIEHLEFESNVERINQIMKYLAAEIWILFNLEFKENLVDYFNWNKWSEKEVDFSDDIITLISDSKRILGFLNILLPKNDKYFCASCGYQSVQLKNRQCLICKKEMEMLV